jgi:copper chaperone CopZ
MNKLEIPKLVNNSVIPIIIFIFVIIFIVILYFIFKPSSNNSLNVKGPLQLSSKVVAIKSSSFSTLDASTAFLKDGEGTFQCFVYLDQLSKTGEHVDCGNNSYQPSCETGLYNDCTCITSSDCTNCLHAGYKHVLSLYGVYVLEIMNVPDASRPNSVAVQLALRTSTEETSDIKSSIIETIPLPPLPQQKWTMITISREGRRVDVYYNNKIVSSNKTMNMICVQDVNGSPVMIGDSGLSGQIGILSFLPNRVSVQDIESAYARLADTRGNPLEISTDKGALTQTFSSGTDTNSILHKLCLDGSCLSLPHVGPNIFTVKADPISTSTLPYA